MGLRCIIGHEYGPPQTERDRRERGSEVVVTVTEYRECDRCGYRRIITENKEVKAEPPTEPAAEPTPEPTMPSAEADLPAEPTEPEFEGPTEPLTAEEDDGIILEDEPDVESRAYGAWPEADLGDDEADLGGDHDPWPGESAEPDDGSEEPAAGGTILEPDDDQGVDPSSTGSSSSPSTGDASASSASPPSHEPVEEPLGATLRPDPRETELVCPDCGHAWPSVNGSLRPGDICPKCRGGYIEERVLQ